MIVDFPGLEPYRGQLTLVDGGFDPLHEGHIAYFGAAAALGHPLLCNIAADDYLRTKHPLLLAQSQRAAIIDALEMIDFTHLSQVPTHAVIDQLRPRIYAKGRDWQDRLPEEELAACTRHGVEIVYLDTVHNSSTDLLEKLAGNGYITAHLQDFENLVHAQQPVTPQTYDADYFTGDWRDGDNRYDPEVRREIEGRHPQLIKEVFEPGRVLDLGCGPGALMLFLHELGVECHGLDASTACREIAPDAVRDRIHTGDITDSHFPADSFDLVICREVFEHLTVLQIGQAVREMCRASSRFVYVTTRFHPEPMHLLDNTTEFEVDPTHINLMHKDLLRLLFILEGYRQRPDLETRIDWLDKRRVLVYEKPREHRDATA